jgi:hypothetical protein
MENEGGDGPLTVGVGPFESMRPIITHIEKRNARHGQRERGTIINIFPEIIPTWRRKSRKSIH